MLLVTRIAAGVLLLALAVATFLGVMAPWSPSGWFALGTATVAAVALSIRDRGVRRGLGAVAAVLLVILLVVRIFSAADGMIRMVTLPLGTSSRWLGSVVDEQDIALAGARVLAMQWRLSPDERKRLLPALREAYVEMQRDDAFTPSPVLDTLLGRQSPGAFDTLVIEPRAEASVAAPAKSGVIFLHGGSGGYTLECWLVARAARAIGAVTVCPATGFSGAWRGEAGEHILRATLDYLHARGIRRVFLAGLSNGAVGASALASRLASSLAGLILISGAPEAGASAGLPTLVVHGADDTMAPATSARAFAARVHASYVNLDGGHFALLTRRAEAREAIAGWLRGQVGFRAPAENRR
jgi:pimeloyl-ACP methyl ester carboxylesterase